MPQGPAIPRETITRMIFEPVEHIVRDDPKQFSRKQFVAIAGVIVGIVGTGVGAIGWFLGQEPKRPAASPETIATKPAATKKQPDQKLDTVEKRRAYAETIKPDECPKCPQCGKLLTVKYNRESKEPFFGCRDFPKCRGSKNIEFPKQ